MSHVIVPGQIGTASLDAFLGLVTTANPSDLPEGASPRCYDVDFITGSCFTRAGLAPVYSFAQTLVIIGYVIYNDIITFTYTGNQPTVNEGFILSQFTGASTFLNGQTVFVLASTATTFTVFFVHDPIGPFTGLSGVATSLTGNFTGPNIGGSAVVVNSSGNVWVNPNSILGNTTYASSTTGGAFTSTVIPGSAANEPEPNQWTSPLSILSTGAPVASVTLATGSVSSHINAFNMGFNLPSNATVTGISTSFSAKSTGAAGTSVIAVQLATNGNGIGTEVVVPISSATTSYTQGSSSYQWGTVLTPTVVNSLSFGVLVQARQGSGSGTFSVNTLSVMISYTTASSSEVLQVTVFAFAIPSSSGVSGFSTTFEAFSSAATTLTFQLLKDGLPVGTTHTQVLTTTPTVYSLGGSVDLWGSTWSFANVNSTQFGIQVTASGLGTSSIKDLDMLVYLTPALEDFNYIKSFVQDNGQTDTLALDNSGILWQEDVTHLIGSLTIVRTGIFPGSFARSNTALDREYICLSRGNFFATDGTLLPQLYGGDRPLVYDGTTFTSLSQVGPGAPPSFVGASGSSISNILSITSWSITGNVVMFTFTAGPIVSAGQIYNITGAVPTYLNIVGVVLGIPAPTATTFAMTLVKPNASGTFNPSAIGTLQFNYPISSITQNPIQSITDSTTGGPGTGGGTFWGAGPGPTHTPGSNLVVYYSQTQDTTLVKYFQAHPTSTYVYLSNLSKLPQFDGTYLVTAVGSARPSSTAGASRFYFVVNVGVQGQAYPDNSTGNYQMTIATITTGSAVAGLSSGASIQITGETPTSWNNSWSIVEALTSATLNVTSTRMSPSGVATYDFSLPSGGVNPVNGQTASITGCNNSGAGYTVSPFNTVGSIVYPGQDGASSFDIIGFTGGFPLVTASENGVAVTYGTQFSIDPALLTIGTATNPIYGNAGATSGTGGIYIVGSATSTPIAAGTRQAVVFFITSTGYETAPSPPIVFTVPTNTTAIHFSNLPIGPNNVIARGIALTEAGQNGIPGANFYVIPNPVQIQVLNSTPVIYGPTIIRDNTTTSGVITFTDAVLLNSTEIDVQGNDLFNLIELGSPAWCVPYANRMFYGLMLNKVDNFVNLTFDGGFNPTATGQNLWPLGWQPGNDPNVTLVNSSSEGMALYITNTSGSTKSGVGFMSQSAYEDVFKVPILNINTTYSVRVTCSVPSSINIGNLVIELIDFRPGTGYNLTNPYGVFTVNLNQMSTNSRVFTGTLLTTPFTTTGVSPNLVLALFVDNMGNGADLLIDRIEVFPTQEPYILSKVYGSYVDNLEAIDAAGSGGILDTSEENPQSCMGGFVMHDNLYLLKTDSMVSTEDNPNSEPGGWGVHEVSNRVGTIGISSYDTGEEWLVTACRSGIYGFNGGMPTPIMKEIRELWEKINWAAGNTIVLRNDIINKRILCAVPLATPNTWLPFDPVNPAPTSPNVILMLNYQGLNTFEELVNSPEMHTSMFGSLVSVDMKRKWSIWRIPTPYMDFIVRAAPEDKPLFVCNGIDSSKIYQFLDTQLSDDGFAINSLYTTYGFVNAEKAATLPIFSFYAKRYTVLQGTSFGQGNMKVRVLQNTLDARYPYTVPGGVNLSPVMNDDWFRPLNIRAQRAYLEFSTSAVNSWFNLSKILLAGRADNYPLNPTGGSNQGFPSV